VCVAHTATPGVLRLTGDTMRRTIHIFLDGAENAKASEPHMMCGMSLREYVISRDSCVSIGPVLRHKGVPPAFSPETSDLCPVCALAALVEAPHE
jgi:hypothetical protein